MHDILFIFYDPDYFDNIVNIAYRNKKRNMLLSNYLVKQYHISKTEKKGIKKVYFFQLIKLK